MLPNQTLIRVFRKQFNISQKKLAQELGISQSNISRIENGTMDPPYSKIITLFNYFLELDPTLLPDYSAILQMQDNLKKCQVFTRKLLSTLKETKSIQIL
jgi:predicted transcriptional regulator